MWYRGRDLTEVFLGLAEREAIKAQPMIERILSNQLHPTHPYQLSFITNITQSTKEMPLPDPKKSSDGVCLVHDFIGNNLQIGPAEP